MAGNLMEKKAVSIIARGRVQGVGFRFFVRESASRLGVVGWVKNRADGAVEIYAEGRKDVLDELIGKVKRGPSFGRVSDLSVDWIEPAGYYTSFDINF